MIMVLHSKDVLREDRATGDPFQGDRSNFLHPVLYYYHQFPSSFKGWRELYTSINADSLSVHYYYLNCL